MSAQAKHSTPFLWVRSSEAERAAVNRKVEISKFSVPSNGVSQPLISGREPVFLHLRL